MWRLPTLDEILEPGDEQDFSADILRRQARLVEDTLESLNAPVRVIEINRGPVVTQFGVEPLVVTNGNGKETKVKISRIAALADDLALALEAKTLRVEAPIPGKGLVGIEVPNPEISLVALRDVMESERFAEIASPLKLCLGQDVSGHPAIADLTAMPHMLIAGTTGSGKSVCINALIAALLLQHTPNSLRFLMVDPKRVELTGYNGIPHLLSKVVVEMERVTNALQWVLREMDGRYRRFSDARAIHIRDYNEQVAPRLGEKPLPYIVVVIDELADLMMMSPQETERSLCRIAQMARATGIHLIIATQRPSVDVVTGLIKANFPARIAFNVASTVDSRVILDMPGAEQLLGRGDMLFLPPDAPTPMRLQGAFVSDEELRRLVQYWKAQARPEAVPAEKSVQRPLWEDARQKKQKVEYEDELLPDVIDVVLSENRASISLLQRKLRIGYTRSARIMDILERHGVVGPQPSGSKAREVFPSAAHALLHPQGERRMSYTIRKLTYSDGRAFRYHISDDTGNLRYVAERTGMLLPSPTHLVEFFDPDRNPSGRLQPPGVAPWRRGTQYEVFVGEETEKPYAVIQETWRLVDILLLRLPRYEIQLGEYYYTVQGSRYGGNLYEIFRPCKEEEGKGGK